MEKPFESFHLSSDPSLLVMKHYIPQTQNLSLLSDWIRIIVPVMLQDPWYLASSGLSQLIQCQYQHWAFLDKLTRYISHSAPSGDPVPSLPLRGLVGQGAVAYQLDVNPRICHCPWLPLQQSVLLEAVAAYRYPLRQASRRRWLVWAPRPLVVVQSDSLRPSKRRMRPMLSMPPLKRPRRWKERSHSSGAILE